MVTTIWHL